MITNLKLSIIAERIHAEWNGEDAEIAALSTDTRHIAPRDLFVALVGPSYNGHDFLASAQEQGAIAAVVSESSTLPITQLKVTDTLKALGEIAALNREQFANPVVGLTGSVGKTSCKEMIAAILSREGEVLATRGNLNNEIGVPQTLLSISPEHEFAVIEMGAAKAGDIAYLMQFVQPDIALLTNARAAHVEGFGSLQGVANSKGEIFTQLKAGGIAIVNADDEFYKDWMEMIGGRRSLSFSLSNKSTDVYADNIHLNDWSTSFDLCTPGGSTNVVLALPGQHNISNALAAAAVAVALDIPLEEIRAGLQSFTGIQGRMQKRRAAMGVDVIDDSYNANPGSVAAAIDVLAQSSQRKVLILGDMAELGSLTESAHQDAGRLAASKGINALYTVGEQSAQSSLAFEHAREDENNTESRHFSNQADLIDYCLENLQANDLVLVKGSRSAAMEQVVDALLHSAASARNGAASARNGAATARNSAASAKSGEGN